VGRAQDIRAETAYQAIRSVAQAAIDGKDPQAALDAAIRCLHAADELLARAQTAMSDAHREIQRAESQRAALENEHRTLAVQRHELMAARDAFEVTRHKLAAERNAATEQQARRRPRTTALPPVPDLDGPSLQPDPATASTPADFMALLRQFKKWSGNPGYRQIASGSGQRYTASALQAALNRDSLPKKQEIVDAVVQGCGGTEDARRAWASAWRRLFMQPASDVPLAAVLAFPDASDTRSAPGSA
jgi:hypothetical protein